MTSQSRIQQQQYRQFQISHGRKRSGRSSSRMMKLCMTGLCMVHTATILTDKGGGADAFNVHLPPDSFYPPPGFDGGGGRDRFRRYEGDSNNNINIDDEDDGYGMDSREDDFFYAGHHPHDDPYFHYHDGRPPPPPFPPPPPDFRHHPYDPRREHHQRFMELPPPQVIITETAPETPQTQLLTKTTASGRYTDSASLRHQPQAETHRKVPVQSIWKTSAPVLVQSSALETFAFDTPSVERVQVLLKTGHKHSNNGRNPLQARIDVWHGPDSTPQNLAIYLEDDDDDDDDDCDLMYADGSRNMDEDEEEDDDDDTTNFSAIIETPQGYNTIAVRNTAPNFDLLACVEGEECSAEEENAARPHMGGDPSGYYYEDTYGIPRSQARNMNKVQPSTRSARQSDTVTANGSPLQSVVERLMATSAPQLLEGTQSESSRSANDKQFRPDIHTVKLAPNVDSVQVLLRTEYMRPLQGRVELILKEKSSANPNDPGRVLKRTIVEVFSEDGLHRPFFAVLETPKKRKRKRRLGSASGDDKQYSVSLRVLNLSGSEFPIFASVEPYVIDTNNSNDKTAGTQRSDGNGEREDPEEIRNQNAENGQGGEDDIMEEDWWEQSMENSHFGGGSHYDMSTNSTILDAEIL